MKTKKNRFSIKAVAVAAAFIIPTIPMTVFAKPADDEPEEEVVVEISEEEFDALDDEQEDELSPEDVSDEGQIVTHGDMIGYSGNTGGSTGPHLHLECLAGGDYYNPIFYFLNG